MRAITLLTTGLSWLAAAPELVNSAPTYETRVNNGSTFDFIIVGGGPAGIALATRLSLGLKHASILLIEAGPPAQGEDRINIPAMRGSIVGTVYDWNLTSVPQQHSHNRVVAQPRGRVLGGSSAMNFLLWDRGSRREYDSWEALGNPGWNFRSMLAAMLRAENFTNTGSYGDAGVARGGPVQTVVNRRVPQHQTDLWFPTLNGVFGVPLNTESLGGNNIGVMVQPSSINPAIYNRSYSAVAYLPLAGSNLHVLPNTVVAKVNLHRKNGPRGGGSSNGKPKAAGVTLQDGTVLNARQEVVLSGGSFLSPALLERSGIGQAAVLRAAGVPQQVELPGVGENLQDHIRVQTSYILNQTLYRGLDQLRHNATYAAEQFALKQAGLPSHYDFTVSAVSFQTWSQVLGSEAQSRRMLALAERSAASLPDSVVRRKRLALKRERDVAQLELIFSDGYTGVVKGFPVPGSPLYGSEFLTFVSGVMHPLSLGTVHIQPGGGLAIDPKYMSNEYDIQAHIEAARYARRVAFSQPLRRGWTAEYEPGLDAVTGDEPDDAGWRDYVLSTVSPIYHPAGTCAMLPRRDGGVVDPALRVYGVEGLRVVDNSIIPLLISGHTQTTAYGIGERAAEIMLGEYGRKA